MPTDPQGLFQKMDRRAKEVNRTQKPRRVNCEGGSFSPPLLLHPRLPLRQAAGAAQPEDLASTTTLATRPSRDTTVTMETTTTNRPARSTLTHPHIRRHRTPLTASALKRDASGGDGNVATQGLLWPVDPQREDHSLGSAPATTPQDRHSISTPW